MLASHTRAVLSSEAVRTRLPSGLVDRTPHPTGMPRQHRQRSAGLGIPNARGGVERCGNRAGTVRAERRAVHGPRMPRQHDERSAGLASQMRAVLSFPAVMTREPSGLNAALLTWSVCPESVASTAPVLASHTRAVLSQDAVTMRPPSGLNQAPFTQDPCPDKLSDAAPVLASQRHRLPVPGRGHDPRAIRAEGSAAHQSRVAGQSQPKKTILGGSKQRQPRLQPSRLKRQRQGRRRSVASVATARRNARSQKPCLNAAALMLANIPASRCAFR